MPRARKDTPVPVEVGDQPTPAGTGAENENRSSETLVVLPAEDGPVRCGGHILTENGWVLEDAADDDGMVEDQADEQGQE